LLHAQAAGRFQPENPGRESVLVQSRAAVEARRQIHFAVAFSDADPRKACSKFNKEFAKTAESAVAGLPDVRMIAPKEAALILAANGAGAMDAKNGTYVFISGKIRCAAPWKDVPRGDHSEGTIEFRPRIAFEIETQDSLSRVSRSVTGAAETFASCFTRIVFSAPTLSPRSIGDPDEVIDSETIPDSSAQGCSINKGKELKELAGRVNTQIRANVIEAFDAVAAHYLDKARASTDPAAAADNYAAFVLMSRDKQSPAYREAVTAIHSYDPDLQPEAIARQGR
jgi:hypothetical protein